jgi:hypothetical protein
MILPTDFGYHSAVKNPQACVGDLRSWICPVHVGAGVAVSVEWGSTPVDHIVDFVSAFVDFVSAYVYAFAAFTTNELISRQNFARLAYQSNRDVIFNIMKLDLSPVI